jgi:S-adenosylmethionine decarboxylase
MEETPQTTMSVAVDMPQAGNNTVVIGKHTYGNLYFIRNRELLFDEEKLTKMMLNAISAGKMHVIEVMKHAFKGGGSGVSVIVLLQESHATIHTWPEGDYATVDIYSCGDEADPQKTFEYIIGKLKPKRIERFYADRSM